MAAWRGCQLHPRMRSRRDRTECGSSASLRSSAPLPAPELSLETRTAEREVLVTSVWCRNAWVPGLPFSRTLGDELAHQVGVTSEAEVTELVLEPQHRVVLLASSSVLELLTCAVRVAPALPIRALLWVRAREETLWH
jgi:hypothetical protein